MWRKHSTFDVEEVSMEDVQKKAILLLGKGKMDATELCSKLNIEPDMRNKLSNGEYYTAFKDCIGLQTSDDAEIDELIQEKHLNDIPNQDVFFLTEKGKEKYNQIMKENEAKTGRRKSDITVIATVASAVVGIIGLIYMIVKGN